MRPLVSSNYTGTPNYPELIGARIVSVIYSVGFLFTNVDASFFFLLSSFLLFLLESNQFGEGEKIYGGKDRSIRANCWRVERRGATISRIGEREREIVRSTTIIASRGGESDSLSGYFVSSWVLRGGRVAECRARRESN